MKGVDKTGYGGNVIQNIGEGVHQKYYPCNVGYNHKLLIRLNMGG